MKALLTAFLLLALPLAATAQRHYAILSLVGDEMVIVQRDLETGSRLDTNSRQAIQMPDASIDRAVVLAVEDGIRKAEPNARTTLLVSRRQSVYDSVTRALDKGGSTHAAFEAVKPVVASAKGATHLILVTKYRAQTRVRIPTGTVGHGNLEGVGFYVDYGSFSRAPYIADAERGVLSPYAYMRVSLIDLASGRVVSEERVMASNGYTVEVGTIGDAWQALSAQEKDRRLQQVLREETARVVPTVIAAR
jgi:hypothetical protein